MALGWIESLSIIKKHVELLKRKKPGLPIRMALLGYQYVFATYDEARLIVGEENLPSLLVAVKNDAEGYGIRTRPLAEYLRDSFSCGLDYLSSGQIFFETFSFFKALGCHCQAFDLIPLEGVEICVDLNAPIPPEFHGKFDIVIDSGTLEHCFHPGEGLKNIVRMLEVDGVAVHYAPINIFDHGYYNFTPEVFTEFYTANNFTVLESMYLRGDHARATRAAVFEEKFVGIVAQKTGETTEIKTPVQLASRRFVDFPQTYTYGPLFRASRSSRKNVTLLPRLSSNPFYDALLRQFSLVCDPDEFVDISACEEFQNDTNAMLNRLEQTLVRESKKFLCDEINRISGKDIHFWVLEQQVYDRCHALFSGSKIAACISRDNAVDEFAARSESGLPFISCKRAALEFPSTPIVIFGSMRDAHLACQELLKVRQDVQFDVIFCW